MLVGFAGSAVSLSAAAGGVGSGAGAVSGGAVGGTGAASWQARADIRAQEAEERGNDGPTGAVKADKSPADGIGQISPQRPIGAANAWKTMTGIRARSEPR